MNKKKLLDRYYIDRARLFARGLKEIDELAGNERPHLSYECLKLFPRLQPLLPEGFGPDNATRYYALEGVSEAVDYLHDPMLGPQLICLCEKLLQLPVKDADMLFGWSNRWKFHASITVFASIGGSSSVFKDVLEAFFDGKTEQGTERIFYLSWTEDA